MTEPTSPFAPPPPAPPPLDGAVLQTTLVEPPPPAARAVTAGSLIGRTFATWRGCLVPFIGLGLVNQAALLAFGWALGSPINVFDRSPLSGLTPELQAWTFSAGYWAYMAGMLLASVLFMGALTEGAVQRLAGQPVRLGGMLSAMLRRAPPLLGAGALAWLATYLGMLLLVVPGVLWGLSFSLVGPVVMAERLGVTGSLGRSRALTRGFRWRLLGAYLVCFVAAGVPSWLAMGLGLVAPLVGGLLSVAGSVVMGPLVFVAPAVAYHDLRVAREGASTAELARVFE